MFDSESCIQFLGGFPFLVIWFWLWCYLHLRYEKLSYWHDCIWSPPTRTCIRKSVIFMVFCIKCMYFSIKNLRFYIKRCEHVMVIIIVHLQLQNNPINTEGIIRILFRWVHIHTYSWWIDFTWKSNSCLLS